MGFVLIRMDSNYQNVVKEINSEKTGIQFRPDGGIIHLRTLPSDQTGPVLIALAKPKGSPSDQTGPALITLAKPKGSAYY